MYELLTELVTLVIVEWGPYMPKQNYSRPPILFTVRFRPTSLRIPAAAAGWPRASCVRDGHHRDERGARRGSLAGLDGPRHLHTARGWPPVLPHSSPMTTIVLQDVMTCTGCCLWWLDTERFLEVFLNNLYNSKCCFRSSKNSILCSWKRNISNISIVSFG